MKSLKKTLVLLVVLSMILSAVSPVFAFNDVIDEDYAEQANKMAAFGVFTGDAEGNFNAEENITRAEMAVVIGRLMGLTTNEANANQNYASAFSDVKAGEWYTGWVNLVAGRGIISGFPDGTFRPNEKVTQAQAVTMIVKALGWGVVVDQTGTWPANYITKASELRLFKDAVDSNSELVTRGNIAIYCYNALTAKIWDVTESTNGQLTSSVAYGDTILAKYFSDFTNEDGKMKLVEDALVTLSGANTAEIGKNQIELTVTGIADFIDAENAPKRDEEEATYKTASNKVVAYVPAEVASVANLAGRKVDVIFGEDNVVAYIVVTDDSVENVYVTAWDGEEIEIDGEVYEFAEKASVAVFGHYLVKEGTDAACESAIDTLFGASELACLNAKDELTKNVIAEFILNGDDEIESINLKFSADEYASTLDTKLAVNEFVVEKISSKNVITYEGTATKGDLDDYEDIKNLRVIKNGEVAEVADIEVGDVVTEVVYDTKVELLIVASNTVEGEVADYLAKTNALEVDGTEYKVAEKVHYNDAGEIDELETYETTTANNETTKAGEKLYKLFEDEAVTAYLNFAGEVVVAVGEPESTGAVLGVVMSIEDEYDDENEVEYVKAKILAEDGTNKNYKIYKNSKKNKDVDTNDLNLEPKNLVVFDADEEREILAEDIIKVTNNAADLDFKSETDVTAKLITTLGTTVDYDAKTIGGLRFSSSTKVINPAEKELISGWSVLAIDDETSADVDTIAGRSITAAEYAKLDEDGKALYEAENAGTHAIKSENEAWVLYKGTKILYVVAWVDEEVYGASDYQYGILVDVDREKDEDDETIYIATVLVNGEEVTYECEAAVRNYEEGSFIKFKVSEGEFKDDPTVLVYKEMVDYIADATSDSNAMADIAKYLTSDYMNDDDVEAKFVDIDDQTTFLEIKVDEVEVVDGETYLVLNDGAATVDLADNYIVYDLENSEMAEEINDGDYVLVYDWDKDDEGFEIVIVL